MENFFTMPTFRDAFSTMENFFAKPTFGNNTPAQEKHAFQKGPGKERDRLGKIEKRPWENFFDGRILERRTGEGKIF